MTKAYLFASPACQAALIRKDLTRIVVALALAPNM